MSKTPKLPPQDKLDLYDRLIDSHPDIERKGVSMPYTSLNGHMFTYLSKTGSLGKLMGPQIMPILVKELK